MPYTENSVQVKQLLTKDNNALVLDINEDGTTVTEDGAVVQIKNYKHFAYVIKMLPQVIEKLRKRKANRCSSD